MKYILSVLIASALIAQCVPVEAVCHRGDSRREECDAVKVTKEAIGHGCLSCNCSKQDRDYLEWYSQSPHFNLQRLIKIAEFIGDKRTIYYEP